MATNDLIEFLRRETDAIASEYKRIQSRVREDPGTAGDQTEENWAAILRMWLPAYYHVVTKGRILAPDGAASPQVDVLVLSPAYPRNLLDKKLYLAGGVVAAFECKTTLRPAHLRAFFETSVALRRIAKSETGTPARELRPALVFGLLAHSHAWEDGQVRPEEKVEGLLKALDDECIRTPVEMPDLVCISDLGTWYATRFFVPVASSPGLFSAETATGLNLVSGYIGHLPSSGNQTESFTPIGALLEALFRCLEWQDPHMRGLGRYMRSAAISGNGSGEMRHWSFDCLSAELREALRFTRLKYKAKDRFDEWSLGPY
jgi:hypothetical protein